jgi:hypothetical protein
MSLMQGLAASIRVLSGVFQAIREFLEMYPGVTLVFRSEELTELWAAHLRREDQQ